MAKKSKNPIFEGMKSEAKTLAREKASAAIGGLFGTGIVGDTMRRIVDKKFGRQTPDKVSGQTILSVQREMSGTLMRIETIAQNISDNLYNIAGVLNAQITSMEQTRRDMADARSRGLAQEEAGIKGEGIARAAKQDAKGLTKGEVLAGAVVRTLPLVLGTALTAILAKMMAERGLLEPGAQNVPLNRARRGEFKTLREAGAANQREALKSKSTITQGVANDIVDYLISNKLNGKEAADFIREFSPNVSLYDVLETCSPAKKKKFIEVVGEAIDTTRPVAKPAAAATAPLPPSKAGAGRGSVNPETVGTTPEGATVTPEGSQLKLHTPEEPGRAPVFEAQPVPVEKAPLAATRSMGTGVQSENEIKEVIEVGPGYNVIKRPDGSIEKLQGARNWRNNNPGNIEYGQFAKTNGAIGTDGRFAIFPTYSAGRKAKEALIFGGKNYKDLDLASAISRYAPPSENNTQAYQQQVLSAVGGQNKQMSQYTAQERSSIMNAMEKVEGYKAGKTTMVAAAPSISPVPASPSTGTQVATASTQVAAAQRAPAAGGNVTVVNNNSGSQVAAAARRPIPSPVADRGSLDENTMFVAAA